MGKNTVKNWDQVIQEHFFFLHVIDPDVPLFPLTYLGKDEGPGVV